MKTLDVATFEIEPIDAQEFAAVEPDSFSSPFAQNELLVTEVRDTPTQHLAFGDVSPFNESYTSDDTAAMDSEVEEMLLAELEDEEFTEALEALAAEATARYLGASTEWNAESFIPVLDPTEAEQWVDSISSEADQLLSDLESQFLDRPVESVTDEELDAALAAGFPSLGAFADPLDARELFFGSLKKKLKKIAKAAKNVVRKGISIASKVLPLGIILRRLRPLIKPLLRRVLGKAIGRLPRSLRGPARRLAQRYGLRPTREFESEFEFFAADFDATIAEAMTMTDEHFFEAFEAELTHELAEFDAEPNAAEQLDAARERLTRQLLEAEAGYEPINEIEQFIPVALYPIVKTGIKLAGRKRVVNFLASMLARLIKPIVGKQLAKPLSVQIADKGLALLRLEAEASTGRLGAEAMVATVEDTLTEVFSMSDELLENELFLESSVQDAFHRAATRHFPSTFLKAGVSGGGASDDKGVWVNMPRTASPLYRYRKLSQKIPARVNQAMASEVVFSDGETLEERLADAGEATWPIDVEFEVYELLPTSSVGHLAAFESETGESSLETTLEFDSLEEAGSMPFQSELKQSGRSAGTRRRLVRVTARGKKLRRRSPVSIRLDVGGPQPVLRLHIWASERRAAALAAHVAQQKHREIVSTFRSMAGDPMRRVVGKRLGHMLARRKITLDAPALAALSNQLFDGLLGAVAQQLPTIGSRLSTAAKDPASGFTVTAAFPFSSKKAIGAGAPGAPTLTIRPGRHRD